MISGTSKTWSKSGPGALLNITKLAQRIQEKLWNRPGKILFMSIWDSHVFENVRKLYVLCTIFVRLSFCCVFCFVGNLGTSFENNFEKMRIENMINFPFINKRKTWIWISDLSKTWNGIWVTFLFSGKGYPTLFYCQGRVPIFYFQIREERESSKGIQGNHLTLNSR